MNIKQLIALVLFCSLGTAAPLWAKGPASGKIFLTLLKETGGVYNNVDGCVVVFNSFFSKGIGNEDSKKILNSGENFCFWISNTNISINGWPTPQGGDTLQLRLFQTNNSPNYKIVLNNQQFIPSTTTVGYLYDSQTQTSTQLDPDSNVIYLPAGTSTNSEFRFSIYFKSTSTVPVTFKQTQIKPLTENNYAVNWQVANEVNVASYQLQASNNVEAFTSLQHIKAEQKNSYSVQTNLLQAYTWARIQATDANGSRYYSAVMAIPQPEKPSFMLINPSQNNQLQFKVNMAKGTYAIQIHATNGKLVATQKLEVANNQAQLVTLGLAQALGNEPYVCTVLNSQNKPIYSTLIQVK